MARKRMVTRTVTTTAADCMCLDVIHAEPINKRFIMSGTYESDEKLLKAVRKAHETEELKIAAVVNVEVINALYGMDENDFLAHAKVLPPRASN